MIDVMASAEVEGFFDGAEPMVVGHRGDRAHHPDNSLSGVMSGLAAVGAVEVDVRWTADGRIALCHDHELDGLVVARSSWDELMALPADRRPIQLDDVIALPGRLDVEVKNLPGQPGFDPHGRLALLAASRLRPGDILTSFYWPDMDRVRELTSVATGLVVGEGGSPRDAVAHAASEGHQAVFSNEASVTEDLVGMAAESGIRIGAWTVDDVHRARELSGMGVAAIISDYPRSLSSVLRE